MYSYVKWNKKDAINGYDKEYWLSNNPMFANGEVILYSRSSSGQVDIIVIESELRKSYNDYSSDLMELAQLRCDSLNGQGFDNLHELIAQNKEIMSELSQAKLILMKEGLL